MCGVRAAVAAAVVGGGLGGLGGSGGVGDVGGGVVAERADLASGGGEVATCVRAPPWGVCCLRYPEVINWVP